jgi:hypothetical protein
MILRHLSGGIAANGVFLDFFPDSFWNILLKFRQQ